MLKPEEDAIGQAFADHINNKGSVDKEIIEFSDGKVAYSGGPEAYLKPFAAWDTNEKESVRWIKPDVLDIGCGAGRFLLHLQKKGISATGIDISPLSIRICESRGLHDVHNQSLDAYTTSRKFRTILMMGNNLGMIGSLKRIAWFFEKINRLLTADGILIANGHNTDQELQIRVRYKHYQTPWMDWLLISENTLHTHASQHGFKLLETYPNDDNSNVVFILSRH